jgi:hypothetical protein
MKAWSADQLVVIRGQRRQPLAVSAAHTQGLLWTGVSNADDLWVTGKEVARSSFR